MTTYYSISGRSTQRPTDLPDGLTVELVKDMLHTDVDSGRGDGWRLRVDEFGHAGSGVLVLRPRNDRDEAAVFVNLSTQAVTALRDNLTTWLDGDFTGRVFLDVSHDTWHEQSPNSFDCMGHDREWQGPGYSGWTLERLTAFYRENLHQLDEVAQVRN